MKTYFTGSALPVVQEDTIQITAFDVATTYNVTIGGITVGVAGITDVNATAAALQAALENSDHPYFLNIVWTVVTDTVTAKSLVSGVPFEFSVAVVGGTGTILDASVVPSTGPNHYDTGNNWSGGSVPGAGDIAILRALSVDILFGLSNAGATLAKFAQEQSYTGRIGLNSSAFATSDVAEDDSVEEYRDKDLRIDVTKVELGENLGPTQAVGSGRVNLDLGGVVSTVEIFNTATAPSETNRPAVKILANNAATNIFVRSSRGGVGIAMDRPDEVSLINKVSVSDTTTTSRVFVGSGVTLDTYEQNGGTVQLNAAADIAAVICNGGLLNIEGEYEITLMTINGGTVNDNHTDAANAIAVLDLKGGTMDGRGSNQTRTWATVNHFPDGTLARDTTKVLVTNYIPTGGELTLSAS